MPQQRNKFSVAATCHLIACILHNVKLTNVLFNHQPSACVGHDAWRSEGLPVPPSEVVAQGWKAVLEFLRAGAKVAVHELRLMLIGDGEAETGPLEGSWKGVRFLNPARDGAVLPSAATR